MIRIFQQKKKTGETKASRKNMFDPLSSGIMKGKTKEKKNIEKFSSTHFDFFFLPKIFTKCTAS